MNHSKNSVPPTQKGVALVVVLIFITILTSISIYAARNTSISEQVARNQLDIEVAREAAEAALRDGEFDLLLPTGDLRTNAICARNTLRPVTDALGQFQDTCPKGQCGFPASRYESSNYLTATATSNTGEPWWPTSKGGLWGDNKNISNSDCETFTGAIPYGTYSGRSKILGVRRQPEYLIERIKHKEILFRITARGFGRGTATEVVLQTYFRPFQ